VRTTPPQLEDKALQCRENNQHPIGQRVKRKESHDASEKEYTGDADHGVHQKKDNERTDTLSKFHQDNPKSRSLQAEAPDSDCVDQQRCSTNENVDKEILKLHITSIAK
jgi:hypothetical protein